MICLTTQDIPGKRIVEILGVAKGGSVRARHAGDDLITNMRALIGGELHEYTKIMAEAREQAMDRMIEEAESLGANAIIGIRFASCELLSNAAEWLAYGTAVRVVDEEA